MTGNLTTSTATGDALLATIVSGATYVSLHSANPGITGASELSGDGYAREAVTLTAASAKATANDGTITFGPASADWVAATYYGLWDDPTAGNFLGGGLLNAPKTVLNTDTASFAASALALTIS